MPRTEKRNMQRLRLIGHITGVRDAIRVFGNPIRGARITGLALVVASNGLLATSTTHTIESKPPAPVSLSARLPGTTGGTTNSDQSSKNGVEHREGESGAAAGAVTPIGMPGPEPKLVLIERSYDFGDAFAGQFMDHAFTIRNEGTAPLTLSDDVPGGSKTRSAQPASTTARALAVTEAASRVAVRAGIHPGRPGAELAALERRPAPA